MQEPDDRSARRSNLRLALILLAIAAGFYFGFILLAMYKAH